MNNNLTSGQQFEMDVLGACSSKINFKINFKTTHGTFEECRIEAMERARREGWNPENPPGELLISKLLLYINVYMGVLYLPYRVLVWRTVDTSFDYSHKIDLYFEIVDESGPDFKYGKVYVDLSVNPKLELSPGITNLNKYHLMGENLAKTAIIVGDALIARLKGENRERGGVHSSDNGFHKI